MNSAYQANHVTKRELIEEQKAHKDLKRRYVEMRDTAERWREQFNELGEKVAVVYRPAIKQLEKFKDWAIDVFDKGGNDEEKIMTAFHGHVERESKKEQELEEQQQRQAYRDRDYGPSL